MPFYSFAFEWIHSDSDPLRYGEQRAKCMPVFSILACELRCIGRCWWYGIWPPVNIMCCAVLCLALIWKYILSNDWIIIECSMAFPRCFCCDYLLFFYHFFSLLVRFVCTQKTHAWKVLSMFVYFFQLALVSDSAELYCSVNETYMVSYTAGNTSNGNRKHCVHELTSLKWLITFTFIAFQLKSLHFMMLSFFLKN